MKKAAESPIAVRDVIEEDDGEIERREGADWGRMDHPHGAGIVDECGSVDQACYNSSNPDLKLGTAIGCG